MEAVADLKARTVEDANGCWNWQGCRVKGYGMKKVGRKNRYVHRLMYERTHGPIPPELVVRHSCDNPACCNPAHLLIGTHKQNTQDAMDRGRWNPPRGESHTNARFTEEQILQIREDPRSISAIAREYKVSRPAIRDIKRRLTWTHI